MVVIKTYGLDPYLIKDLSKDLNSKLIEIYENKKEEIVFLGIEGLFYYDGNEQNSWNIVIEVNSNKIYKELENKIKKVLIHYFSEASINIDLFFNYFDEINHHQYLNPKYDRFLKEKEDIKDDFNEEENYSYSEDIDEEDIYLDDAFKGFEEKINKK